MNDIGPTTACKDGEPDGTRFPEEDHAFDLPPPPRENSPKIEAVRRLFESRPARKALSPDGVVLLRQRTELLAGVGYEVVQPLGRGAMGEVYLARHLKLN